MRFLLFSFMFIALSCDAVVEKGQTSDTTENYSDSVDTVRRVVIMDTLRGSSIPSVPAGVYSLNNNSNVYYVKLNDDKTYMLQPAEHNKRSALQKTEGSWAIEGDEVLLHNGRTVVAKLNVANDSIRLTEMNGSAVKQPLMLQKHELAGQDTAWTRKAALGMEFYGVGNEPFWNIEIDDQGKTIFKMADWKQPLSLKTAKASAKGDSIHYVFNDAGKTAVTIYNTYCNDGMSDRLYTRKVRVKHKGQTYSGCGEYFNQGK